MLNRGAVRPIGKKDAVSEVIANILILTTTITLFAGIFYFVGTLPGPQQGVLSEFAGTIESENGFQSLCTGNVFLNITHRGGPALFAADIFIFIISDGVAGNSPFTLATGGIIDGQWNAGDVWAIVTPNTGASALGKCVDPSSDITLTVVDTPHARVVWEANVLPKVSLFGPQVFGGIDPSPAPIGQTFMLWARIIDIEGVGIQSVAVNSADLNLTNAPMTYNFARDRWEINPAGPLGAGRYSFDVTATNALGQTTVRRVFFIVGALVASGPDLEVDDDFITFSVSNPVRGTVVTINAVIFNLGATPTPANVTFYLDRIDPATVIGRVNLTTIAAAGGESAEIRWVAAPAGPHLIWVKADTFPSPAADANPGNNQDAKQFAVLPRILLVDDDQEPDSSPTSSVSFMKASLYATDFPYDLFVNGGGTGPDYDTGNTRMKDYDVVIWMPGRDASLNTLTEGDAGGGEDDIGHLTQFLDNGGRLWLISEGVGNEGLGGGGSVRVRNFLETYTGLDSTATVLNSGTPAVVQSTGTPLWDFRVTNHSTAVRWAPDGTDKIATTSPFGNLSHVLRDRANPTTNIYAINKTGPVLLGEYRTVYQTLSFNFVKDPGDQAQITYRVLLWLAGIQKKLGRDLAVSDYSITPTAPRYQQDVTLNVTVRNNGDQAETGFQVLFTDIFLGVETTIGAPITVGTLGPFGESTNVLQNWRPDKVGLHILRAQVDWNNKVPETNENNNEVSNLLFSGEVFVGYNILVVDDDNLDGAAIGAVNYNSTRAILDDFADINAGLARPILEYDLHYVPFGQVGPSLATMQRYNAIVWNTGVATPSATSFLLTKNDRIAIQDFLRASAGGSMFLLMAPNIRNEIALNAGLDQIEYNAFMRDNFGVGDMLNSTQNSTATTMYGTLSDDVSHGMRVTLSGALGNGAGAFSPKRASLAAGPTNYGLFHSDAGDDYWTIGTAKYFGTRRHDTTFNFRAAWLGFSPAYVTNVSTPVPRSEITYMALHWMGVPDPRANAKITPPDIFVSAIGVKLNDEHLEIQQSYILKIQMRNTGQKTLNGLALRFLDSGTIIATESASVGPSSIASNWQVNDGLVVVEAIWTPLFAGIEEIEVVVDPDNIIAERTKVDNRASQSSQVFFFYDDLEGGEGKWKHEGVVARINGENPIDFIPLGVKAQTDIRGTFQYTDYSGMAGLQRPVVGLKNYSDFSHSDPNSFWFPESPPKPLDVAFVIDRTGSMGFATFGSGQPCDGQTITLSCKWVNTRAGFFAFLDKMKADNPKHRAALITFSASSSGDSNPGRLDLRNYFGYGAGGIFLDQTLTSDITLLKAAFNNTSPFGGTNMMDATAFATWWLMGTAGSPGPTGDPAPTARGPQTDNAHFPAVIMQTDGVSNSDAVFNSYAQLSCGADTGATAASTDLPPLLNYYRNTYGLPVFTIGLARDINDACLYDVPLQQIADASAQISARGCQTLGTHTFCRQYYFGDPASLVLVYDAIFQALKGGVQNRAPGHDLGLAPPGRETMGNILGPESFESALFPPTNWGRTNVVGATGDWTRQNPGTTPPGGGTWLARFDSGTSTVTQSSERLFTPVLPSMAGYTSVALTFYLYMIPNTDPGISLSVQVSTDGGTSYTTIANYLIRDIAATAWVQKTIDLSSYMAQSNMRIGFLANKGTDTVSRQHVYLDLVDIHGTIDPSQCVKAGQGPGCGEQLVPRRWAVTPVLDLRGATSVRMTMWHRANMLQGQNGGLLQVGVPVTQCPPGWLNVNGAPSACSDNPTIAFNTGGGPVSKSVLREADGWHWNYITPLQPYNSNMNLNKSQLNTTTSASATSDTAYLMDEDGFPMVFAWSAVSAQGKFEWEYAEFDLTRWAGLQNVRLNLSYFQFAGGTGWGWWVDDLTVTVTRGGNSPTIEARDRWVFRDDPTQPGNEAFFNDMTYWKGAGNVSSGGLDNSLFSTPIALTSARLAYLSFDTRFNVNSVAGNPPDSVRVEISQDNGNSWSPINLGIRMDSGVSGGGASPTWVNSGTLARLESNLSGWAGSVIRLRFRIVTATDGRLHLQTNPGGGPQNFGIWVDNVRIFGQSTKLLTAPALGPGVDDRAVLAGSTSTAMASSYFAGADPGATPAAREGISRFSPTATAPAGHSPDINLLGVLSLVLSVLAFSIAKKKEDEKPEESRAPKDVPVEGFLESHPLFSRLRKKDEKEAGKEG